MKDDFHLFPLSKAFLFFFLTSLEIYYCNIKLIFVHPKFFEQIIEHSCAKNVYTFFYKISLYFGFILLQFHTYPTS